MHRITIMFLRMFLLLRGHNSVSALKRQHEMTQKKNMIFFSIFFANWFMYHLHAFVAHQKQRNLKQNVARAPSNEKKRVFPSKVSGTRCTSNQFRLK
jgi:hypothetical protein